MTTWYRDGLVTLTYGSDVVSGVGTAWFERIKPGGIFFGPSGFVQEVSRVTGDGSLQLVEPYKGSTLSGVGYAIAPTQGYVVELSNQVAAVLTNFGDLNAAWLAGDLKGEPGTGLQIKGSRATVGELPSTATLGDGFFVGERLYVWIGTWFDAGPVRGPQGLKGDPGDLTPAAIAARNAAQEAAAIAVAAAQSTVDLVVGTGDYGSITEDVVTSADYGSITEEVQ